MWSQVSRLKGLKDRNILWHRTECSRSSCSYNSIEGYSSTQAVESCTHGSPVCTQLYLQWMLSHCRHSRTVHIQAMQFFEQHRNETLCIIYNPYMLTEKPLVTARQWRIHLTDLRICAIILWTSEMLLKTRSRKTCVTCGWIIQHYYLRMVSERVCIVMYFIRCVLK